MGKLGLSGFLVDECDSCISPENGDLMFVGFDPQNICHLIPHYPYFKNLLRDGLKHLKNGQFIALEFNLKIKKATIRS